MKTLITLLVLISLSLSAQESNEEMATIYFLKRWAPAGPSLAIADYARIDGKPVVKMGGFKYSIHKRKPGNYEVSVTSRDNNFEGIKLKTTIEAGKTYYFDLARRGGLHCEELSEEIAKHYIKELRMKEEDRYLDRYNY